MVIPACLVDTNILLRLTRHSDPQHNIAVAALSRLALQGSLFHYTFQNVAELWNVMTRPVSRNGMGLSVVEAEREVRLIEADMVLLPDNEAVYREWRRIVVQHGVSGVQVHDARLAATMYVHNVRHILTFNVADFTRFSGLTTVDPHTV